jgi:polysaccharide export outer membrane protein
MTKMVLLTLCVSLSLAHAAALPDVVAPERVNRSTYVIGPDDQLLIQVQDAPDIGEKPLRVDPNGLIYLPMAGEVTAAGRNVQQLSDEIRKKLLPFIIQPHVTVNVIEPHSRPVSVLGSVTKPGEYQLVDAKSLYQVLSLAGGLSTDAGSLVTITRKNEYGAIPLANASHDSSGRFSVASVPVKYILDASHPQENIAIEPYDVISVPRADRVYVVGDVQKPGAFLLNDRQSVTILQALSLAEGLQKTAASQRARILHHVAGTEQRVDVTVDLKRILAGKDADMAMHSEDILFIPTSAIKQMTTRAVEAVIQTGSGLLIWR